MPDESVRCAGCGSVRENGRWVRRASGPAAAVARPAAPVAPAPRRDRPPARGCLIAGLAAVGAGLGLLVAVVVISARAPAPAPAMRWSDAYAATFEAACRDTGAGADSCRCTREEAERRIPEGDMVRFQRLIARGSSLDDADRHTLREVERRCAQGVRPAT